MSKIYNEQNVLDASFERLEYAFNHFDNIYFSFSGGKDSSVMIQLAAIVARKLNKKFDVLYIDLEAQYQATITHVEELREELSDVINEFYWIALPMSLRNASSIIQPKWICWDKNDEHKWIRPLPKDSINEDNHEFDFFFKGMEFEQFIVEFAEWYQKRNGLTGAGIGIRSDESLNRFRTIVMENKTKFNNVNWTTKITDNVYNFYPIYDWETSDIWGAVSQLNLKFNYIYELMYKNGLSIHQQRLCQPYGDDQRDGIDQFRYIEPETWELVLNRVQGVNFSNIYARTSLLGNIKSEKPESMSWEQYSIFLLESMGIYAPELRNHYHTKIKKFLKFYEDKHGMIDIPDVNDRKLESAKKVASWRRIARALEKNDFWLTGLSFGQTKSDVKRLYEMREKYADLIKSENTNQKHLKELAEELERNEN